MKVLLKISDENNGILTSKVSKIVNNIGLTVIQLTLLQI